MLRRWTRTTGEASPALLGSVRVGSGGGGGGRSALRRLSTTPLSRVYACATPTGRLTSLVTAWKTAGSLSTCRGATVVAEVVTVAVEAGWQPAGRWRRLKWRSGWRR
jgi:hypothetical protein